MTPFVIAALTQAIVDVIKTLRFLPPMSSAVKFAVAAAVSFLLALLISGGVDWTLWGTSLALAHVLHVVIRLLLAGADRVRLLSILDQRLSGRR